MPMGTVILPLDPVQAVQMTVMTIIPITFPAIRRFVTALTTTVTVRSMKGCSPLTAIETASSQLHPAEAVVMTATTMMTAYIPAPPRLMVMGLIRIATVRT
jgi:hypothetical protein